MALREFSDRIGWPLVSRARLARERQDRDWEISDLNYKISSMQCRLHRLSIDLDVANSVIERLEADKAHDGFVLVPEELVVAAQDVCQAMTGSADQEMKIKRLREIGCAWNNTNDISGKP